LLSVFLRIFFKRKYFHLLSKISIIVPCYNQEEYLAETLDSVLAQTYQDWECVIVNDGSTDHSEDIARSYCAKDSRFKHLQKENGGLSSARNAGIHISTGIYILPLDADDLIHPDYTNEAVQLLDENEGLKLVYANVEFFGSETGLWGLPGYSIDLLALRNIIYCSAVYRRSDYEKTNGYSEEMIYGLEDWDFWLSLLKTGGDVYRITKTYFFYRKKEQSMIKGLDAAKIDAMERLVYEHHKEFYQRRFGNPIVLLNKTAALNTEIAELKRELALLHNSRFWKIRRLFLRRD
jgi:glycosyltransferase involved in cell wall biosynthesis